MHNSLIKRFISVFFAAVLTVLSAGCGEKGVYTIKIEEINQETDQYRINAQIPVIGGITPTDAEKTLNDGFKIGVQTAMEEFIRQSEDNMSVLRQGNKGVLEIKDNVHYNENNFISLVEERYSYVGGAHGNVEWIAHNIDMEKGLEIKLPDLFKDEGWRETLIRLMDEILQANKDEYKDLWEKPMIDSETEEDFYISDGRLIIYYPPYKLSYYARGVVEFPISLNELQGYLKEEYLRLI